MPQLITEYPQFFTASIRNWFRILQFDPYKNTITGSLRFMVEQNRIRCFAFVIMPQHFHLIWQMQSGKRQQDVQRDFLKFTAEQIRFDLVKNNPASLTFFYSDLGDRIHQFWMRRSLSIALKTHRVFLQQLNYIHRNPVKAGLTRNMCDYPYSSARFYETGIDPWGFLTHYRD